VACFGPKAVSNASTADLGADTEKKFTAVIEAVNAIAAKWQETK